jgi:hypothetical protein
MLLTPAGAGQCRGHGCSNPALVPACRTASLERYDSHCAPLKRVALSLPRSPRQLPWPGASSHQGSLIAPGHFLYDDRPPRHVCRLLSDGVGSAIRPARLHGLPHAMEQARRPMLKLSGHSPCTKTGPAPSARHRGHHPIRCAGREHPSGQVRQFQSCKLEFNMNRKRRASHGLRNHLGNSRRC